MNPKTVIATKLAGAFVATMVGISPGTANTVGVAVGAFGSSTQVGLPLTNTPGLGGPSIGFFIPLGDTDGGVYGTTGLGNVCGPSGFGTCADSGNGGARLAMILRFSPVSITSPSQLTVNFNDLDLQGVNDPLGFLESLQVFEWNGSAASAITPLITSIGGLVTGNSNQQQLSLALGTLTADPLFLQLNFRANAVSNGTNTEEFLRATVSTVPGSVAGAGLPGLMAACGGLLISLARRRRQRVA